MAKMGWQKEERMRVVLESEIISKDFPGSPVVKTLSSSAEGIGLIPGQGAKISHSSQPKNQNIKQKQCCNKFNKDFKNGPHPEKKEIYQQS